MTATRQQLAVKESPILFSAPMVKAILDGTKTMTRRIVKDKPGQRIGPLHSGWVKDGFGHFSNWESKEGVSFAIRCPYEVGQHLWVRETWATDFQENILYRATDESPSPMGPYGAKKIVDGVPSIWRMPIFMPRRASRITLEITDIRVERLQEISEEDAEAEGLFNESGLHLATCGGHSFHADQDCQCGTRTAQEEFARIWDRINGKRASWESNPWVWVVTFRRIEE